MTERYVVSRGLDGAKDQSYALWGLTQESLSRTMFPLGEMTKSDARARAAAYGLGVAGKGESYEICFIPDDDYERFLKDRVPGLAERVRGGEVVMEGKVVGTHRGYPFYTIGQRKGLGVAGQEPLYVTGIDPAANRIEIGRKEQLFHGGLVARNLNMVKYADCRGERRGLRRRETAVFASNSWRNGGPSRPASLSSCTRGTTSSGAQSSIRSWSKPAPAPHRGRSRRPPVSGRRAGQMQRTKGKRMMLKARAVNIYGMVAIGAMLLMLVLVRMRVVPPRFYFPLFYVAAALFAVRIVLRIALARQEKKKSENAPGEAKGDAEES